MQSVYLKVVFGKDALQQKNNTVLDETGIKETCHVLKRSFVLVKMMISKVCRICFCFFAVTQLT